MRIFLVSLLIILLISCKEEPPQMKCLQVKASAYNSLPNQTRPGTEGNITAWGDKLVDSIPSIAISRDLLDSGLVYGTLVNIKGFEDAFIVNDKMNRRYKNRIDIHMGRDVKKARKWGVKKVEICWKIPEADTLATANLELTNSRVLK